MKKILSLLCVLCASVVIFAGCHNPPLTTVGLNTDQDHNITGSVTSQVTSNLNVGVQGSGNPSTGDWSAGVVITFKDAASIDQTTQWALEAANAEPVNTAKGGPVFMIAKADWSNPEFRNALMQAIKHGATITGL